MCSLQYAAQLEQSTSQSSPVHSEDDKVQELIDMIEVHLAAY
jgi:hypothetical protein